MEVDQPDTQAVESGREHRPSKSLESKSMDVSMTGIEIKQEVDAEMSEVEVKQEIPAILEVTKVRPEPKVKHEMNERSKSRSHSKHERFKPKVEDSSIVIEWSRKNFGLKVILKNQGENSVAKVYKE